MTLAGKHALVTGGGTGIGLGIARALADAGAEVTITGRRTNVLEQAAASHAGLFAQAMDVADPDSVRDGFAAAIAARGPVAVHIANAAQAEARDFTETDFAFWRGIMTTNLDGAFLGIQESLKPMLELGWGRVIAISSVAGLKGAARNAAYCASKHGLNGLIRSLAAEYATSNITFNAICPGFAETSVVGKNIASVRKRTGASEAEARQIIDDLNPHRRLVSVEEIAATALWLAGPDTASVNGQTIEVSGGVM